jgi:hypothetical protein
MTWDDVSNWAYILSGRGPDEMAVRLAANPQDQPTFVLLEILRRDISKVKSLKMLLTYAWDHVANRLGPHSSSLLETRPGTGIEDKVDKDFQPDVSTSSATTVNSTIPNPESVGSFRNTLRVVGRFPVIRENSFMIMISRFLYQSRRIWPPAMVSVSHMVGPYFQLMASRYGDSESVGPSTLARLCKINNYLLRLLALPSSAEPFKSMVYNWSAQKVLLELAGNFDPPLALDQGSYRAIVQVLAASKKTEREARSATFRSRSWPPWRVEQDGMDAQRPQDEDLSRVVLAIMRSKESGYKPDLHEEMMAIFGGLDRDGTPTIHTRKFLKLRPLKPSSQSRGPSSDVKHWAARVEATRDVHEAWGAFREFQRKGGKPNMPIYLAMFQKINSESRRLGQQSENDATPGDGREVAAVSNDNFTTFYRSRLQPPSLLELYKEMNSSGIRPSGRCLSFLLQHARTMDEGLRYLLDSGLDMRIVEFLAGGDKSKLPVDVLAQLSDRTFTDFLSLLCRFALRLVKAGPDSDLELTQPIRSMRASSLKYWTVRESRARKSYHHRLKHPLHYAGLLLKQRQPRFRPAWYTLFRTLARSDIIISRDVATDPERCDENHEQAWRVTKRALQHFHNRKLELDPHGFLLICLAFAKYAGATFHDSGRHRVAIIAGSRIVKAEFANLTDGSEKRPNWIPKLLHSIGGVHLHAYVRAMGLIEDHAAIISALEWMVENHEDLDAIVSQSRNGHDKLRQTLVATRVFCDDSGYEDVAKALVEKVESWEGWPDDEEVQRYIARGGVRVRIDDDVGIDEEENEDSEEEEEEEDEGEEPAADGSGNR